MIQPIQFYHLVFIIYGGIRQLHSLEQKKGDRVLDCATGTGDLSLALRKQLVILVMFWEQIFVLR